MSLARRPPRPGRWVAVAALVAVLGAAIALGGPLARELAVRILRAADPGAPGVAIDLLAAAFTIAAALLPLPIEAPALLNGVLFPPVRAFVLTWLAVMVGCGLSYELGRRLGRRPADRLFGAARMARIEALVERAGWPTLLGLRLSPVMAFTALNWASGILALSRPVFYWTTAVGITPGTLVFTVTPHLLERRGALAAIVIAASAAMVILIGWSIVRMRRPAPSVPAASVERLLGEDRRGGEEPRHQRDGGEHH
ncbi:MAG: TVP38/TMEM64 family protein [Gemmatimonadales bacterium]